MHAKWDDTTISLVLKFKVIITLLQNPQGPPPQPGMLPNGQNVISAITAQSFSQACNSSDVKADDKRKTKHKYFFRCSSPLQSLWGRHVLLLVVDGIRLFSSLMTGKKELELDTKCHKRDYILYNIRGPNIN